MGEAEKAKANGGWLTAGNKMVNRSRFGEFNVGAAAGRFFSPRTGAARNDTLICIAARPAPG